MARAVAVLAVLGALAAGGCGAPGPVRVPEALPADVPLPAGSVLRMARDQGERGITLGFESARPVAEVAREVRAGLEARGWVLLSDVIHEEAVFESYRKAERSVAIGVSRSGETTLVGVTYRRAPLPGEGEQG